MHFLSSSLISTVLCCNTVPPGSSSAFILKCISSSKAHGHCDKKISPDWPKAFGAFKSLWRSPASWGSCSLIGRIVCVAVAARDAGTERKSSRDWRRWTAGACVCLCWSSGNPAPYYHWSQGLATLARISGSWHSPWLATIQRLPVLHCVVLYDPSIHSLHLLFIHSFYLASHNLLHGAMWTGPWKINSGCQSKRGGGQGPGGHLVGVLGSPGRVALVMAASRPVRLWQRQTLPEVLQLCLQLLPFYCQLLSLGHQLLHNQGSQAGRHEIES